MLIEQLPVIVDNWPSQEEVYQEGARDKSLLVCPADCDIEGLIPKHFYLFKESNPRYPVQFWAEVVAFYVGNAMGIEVPIAYPATLGGRSGALIEWFVGLPDAPEERYFPGGDFLQWLNPSYDREKGFEHNFEDILRLGQLIDDSKKSVLDDRWEEYWLRSHLFDALIGNSDRHHENWGLLSRVSSDLSIRYWRFAPHFDNGTALGHEIFEQKFDVFYQQKANDKAQRYIDRGKPHMNWESDQLWTKRLSHHEFLRRFFERFPSCMETARELLMYDEEELVAHVMSLTLVDNIEVPLSVARAEFMLFLLSQRRQALLALIDECES
jgi:hypothetical protein